MTLDEARAILAENITRDRSHDVLRGLQLLAEICPESDDLGGAEHDQIWAGADFEESVSRMTPDQVRQMASWGWCEDSDGGWTKPV